MKLFIINPGSTSTKVALFENDKQIWSETQRYDTDVISAFDSVGSQEEFRFNEINKILVEKGVSPHIFDAVVGRGGLLHPVKGGTYEINKKMIEELLSSQHGEHASNLGAPLAARFAETGGSKARAFIVDPVVVDELVDEARVSGLPEINRHSILHALNQKAVARQAAAKMGKTVQDCNFIVAHMGGGVSVGAHENGRIIDVNNALDGEGPMSPERSGALPAGKLVSLCFSGKYTQREIEKKLVGNGGLVAHLGTNDLREVEKRIENGDSHAELIFNALCLQIAKEIGSCSAVLKGKVDKILLTGGLAYSDKLCGIITNRVSFIAPVELFPGEDEMQALAEGALRVLEGIEPVQIYK
ncbi:MAG: butyrate kinase [Synergistaceae bacterium]|nr:butyrate kinase [Synergistaceae bacterium]